MIPLLAAAVSVALIMTCIGLFDYLVVRPRMHYLAIDPGAQNSGWAKFAKDGSDLGLGAVKGGPDGLMDFLENLDPQPKVIILEQYVNMPGVNPLWRTNKTEQLIGAIKRHAKRNNITVHEQRNTVLSMGLRMNGFYKVYYDDQGKKKKHVDDEISAHAHGVYWLQTHGIRKSRIDTNGK